LVGEAIKASDAAAKGCRPPEKEPQPPDDLLIDPKGIRDPVECDDVGLLELIERQSVADSVDGLLKFAERRLPSLVADQLALGVGGRIVDLAFQVYDMVTSIRALGSNNPILEVPLPFPIPGIDFSLNIPLAGSEAAPLAVCIAPGTPSLTGGWALDSPEQGQRPDSRAEGEYAAQQPIDDAEEERLERQLELHKASCEREDTFNTGNARQPELRIEHPPVTGCIIEVDLGSLPLLKRRKLRAWELYVLATEYAPQLWKNPDLRRFKVLVIADPTRRFGLWTWHPFRFDTEPLRSDAEPSELD
jgi:hypothetical protein